MRLAVIGGGWFVGRALAKTAASLGHEVAVFNRGSRQPPPGVVQVVGDRTVQKDLQRLADLGPFDGIVDVPGVVPAQVCRVARVLAPSATRYAFISTVSAYRDWPGSPVTESSPLYPGDPDADPDTWTWGAGTYGRLKAGAEAALHSDLLPDRLMVLRPGVILGPGEYSNRLTWWLRRAAQGGTLLGPGAPRDPLRPVDVRDLALFMLHLLRSGTAGVFNVAGPPDRDTFADLLDACLMVTGVDGQVCWVDSSWLIGEDVKQWTQLPRWRTAPGTWAIDTTKAQAAGLLCRPLSDTVAGTWVWLQSGGVPVEEPRAALHGLPAATEAELLARWLSRPATPPEPSAAGR